MPFGLSAFAVKAIGIGLLALALLGALSWLVHDLKAQGAADLREQVNAATAAQTALDNAETQRRLTEQQGIIRDAQQKASAASAEASRADAARDTLRVQLAAYVRSHQGAASAPATAGSIPTDDPIGVLATVLTESDDFAGKVAAEADANRIAGEACVKSYNELTR